MINICEVVNQGEEEEGEHVEGSEQGHELVPVDVQEVEMEHGEGFINIIQNIQFTILFNYSLQSSGHFLENLNFLQINSEQMSIEDPVRNCG